MTDSYHVVAVDLPGHGESLKDFTLRYGIDDQVRYLVLLDPGGKSSKKQSDQ